MIQLGAHKPIGMFLATDMPTIPRTTFFERMYPTNIWTSAGISTVTRRVGLMRSIALLLLTKRNDLKIQ